MIPPSPSSRLGPEEGDVNVGAAGEHPEEASLRRMLVTVAAVLAVFGVLHLVDHAVRGQIVDDHHLNHEWNHSGWPLRHELTPYTVSLVIPVVFVVGMVLTLRRRVWANFWLIAGIVVTAVVVLAHFVPGPQTETLGVVYRTYDRGVGSPLLGGLAVLVVAIILAALATLTALALRARRVPTGS
jgi:hypothetical protein